MPHHYQFIPNTGPNSLPVTASPLSDTGTCPSILLARPLPACPASLPGIPVPAFSNAPWGHSSLQTPQRAECDRDPQQTGLGLGIEKVGFPAVGQVVSEQGDVSVLGATLRSTSTRPTQSPQVPTLRSPQLTRSGRSRLTEQREPFRHPLLSHPFFTPESEVPACGILFCSCPAPRLAYPPFLQPVCWGSPRSVQRSPGFQPRWDGPSQDSASCYR